MATISGVRLLAENDLYTTWTTAPSGYSVGDLAFGDNGKGFRLALVGASTLVVGNMLQSSAIDTQFNDMATTAQAAGLTAITLTNGTTTVSANQFVGGTLEMSVTPGLGDEYTILGHTTGASGETLTFNLDRPLRTATTTSTKITLRRSPWSGVIQSPATTLTGTPAGVALVAATTGTYCWVQTKGVAAVLSDASSILVGSEVAVPSGTAGCVVLSAAGLANVGYAMRAAATGKTIPVFLTID